MSWMSRTWWYRIEFPNPEYIDTDDLSQSRNCSAYPRSSFPSESGNTDSAIRRLNSDIFSPSRSLHRYINATAFDREPGPRASSNGPPRICSTNCAERPKTGWLSGSLFSAVALICFSSSARASRDSFFACAISPLESISMRLAYGYAQISDVIATANVINAIILKKCSLLVCLCARISNRTKSAKNNNPMISKAEWIAFAVSRLCQPGMLICSRVSADSVSTSPLQVLFSVFVLFARILFLPNGTHSLFTFAETWRQLRCASAPGASRKCGGYRYAPFRS